MSNTTTTTKAEPVPAPPTPTGRSRPRRGTKRTQFQVPTKMPVPIRALWQGASEEQRQAAHRTAVAILKTWLGKEKREEAAKELGLSGVRFWQLSQQAVSRLVVGCLRQPRFRGRPPKVLNEEGVGALAKRIATLERELESSRRLIEVLKELPGIREARARPGAEKPGEPGRGGATRPGAKPAAAAEPRAAGVDRRADGERA
jgi:hypothetical protein